MASETCHRQLLRLAQSVELAGGDPRPNVAGDKVERFGREDTGSPHPLECFEPVNLDTAIAHFTWREAHHHVPLIAEYRSHRL